MIPSALCCIRDKIFEDKVNKSKINVAIMEYEDFCKQESNEEFNEEKHLNEQTRLIYNKFKQLL